jgi:segregation and condensation protein A
MYKVKLENFAGPLDLLLYFIRRDEIDVYDIPIAQITAEYMETIDMMQTLNLNFAGEFILMAATLMRIKAKMLLPKPQLSDEDEVEDPRAELVQQLLEYQRFKEMAYDLDKLAMERRKYHPRGFEMNSPELEEDAASYLKDVTLYEIARLFKNAMDNMPVIQPYELHLEQVHLGDQKALISRSFDIDGRLRFSALIKKLKTKLEVVVTFLAVLELIRMRQIIVIQNDLFGEMEIQRIGAEA